MNSTIDTLVQMTIGKINSEFGDSTPTLDQVNSEAESIRSMAAQLYPISDAEFNRMKEILAANVLHTIGVETTLKGRDNEHQSWYFVQENDNFYWNRYKKYLGKNPSWGIDIVNRLNQTTDNIMDNLGNPRGGTMFQRRGLLLGDVQSGKTATYTAICNKAADAGYKVIIVLAGMIENLRVQTQQRLDKEFVGIDSQHSLDTKRDNSISIRSIGVGTIPPFDQDKRINCFTSVDKDFHKNTLQSLGLSLRGLKEPALFVVKKNKSVLNNLNKWLMDNNADYENGLIDLPLLLIDDEADNASVNTNSEEKDPTAINKAIRSILNNFRQATYLGITATPFANIFIDPEPGDDDGALMDLFPKDFLTVLPTPEHYIGANRIFGVGDADDWEGSNHRQRGEYEDSIIPILNEEQENFFRFKHKKDLADELYYLPKSMEEAIRYFVLVTGISDSRFDSNEHRSMLINVSRFTDVQNRTAELVEEYVQKLKNDIENYSKLPVEKASKIKHISDLADTWTKYDLSELSGIDWPVFLKDYLHKAARRIVVRAVNQKHGATSLDYRPFDKAGMRVIAVGGNSLSRGITLEGLCVSYFYRNTMMYDTLLQMGRWFGYRENYDDLCKLWMAEETIDWYGYIADAVNELKEELKKMEKQNQTPSEFGLKVRQAPGSLLITARNKMRTGTTLNRPITVSRRMIETPRLLGDATTVKENESLCLEFIKKLNEDGFSSEIDNYVNAYIWRNVPKEYVIETVGAFLTHPWNLNFQPAAIVDYIRKDDGPLNTWDIGIPFGTFDGSGITIECSGTKCNLSLERRQMEWDSNIKNCLRINGHHVRVGVGGCSKIGLKEETITGIRRENPKPTDKDYLIKDRKPIMLIHALLNSTPEDKRVGKEQPNILFALGLGFPDDGNERVANYVVNSTELNSWVDVFEESDDDND